jgi:flagellar hook-length control protein FliK
VHKVLVEGGNFDVGSGTGDDSGDFAAAFPRLSTATPSALQQALTTAGVRLPEPVDGQPIASSLPGSLSGNVTGMSASASVMTAAPAMRSEFAVAEPFGGERWAQAVGERVMMLVGRDHQIAELKLTPPNLGQLEVRVSVQQDQASVAFVSQHAAVRDALEQAIPRLREMLAQQDLQLVNVDVSQRETGQQAGSGEAGHGRSGSGGGDLAGDGAAPTESGMPSGRLLQGMVDLFA